MKNIFDIQISTIHIFEFCLVGLLLIVSFFILNKFFPILRQKYKAFRLISPYLPLTQLVIIVLFLTYFTLKIFQQSPIYYFLFFTVLVGTILLGSYDYIQNAMEGILLKMENQIELESYIQTKNFSGKVKEMGLFSLVLEEGDRKEIRIPYKLLTKEIVLKKNFQKNIMEHSFLCEIKDSTDMNEVEKNIHNILLTHSWVSVKKPARIQPVRSLDKGRTSLEITIYCIGNQYNKEIENKIHKSIKDLEKES